MAWGRAPRVGVSRVVRRREQRSKRAALVAGAILLCCGLAPTAGAFEPDGEASPISAVVLRGAAVDHDVLADDLSLRLPEIPLEERASAEGLTVYVILTREGERYLLDAVVSDGRAYRREIQTDPDRAAREIAAAVAILVHGIADGTAVPERQDVDVTELVDPELIEPELIEPEPVEPERVEPEPEPPIAGDPPEPDPEPPPAQTRPGPAAAPTVGPRVGAGVVVPAAPTSGPVSAGPSLGLEALFPGGGQVLLDTRLAARATDGFSLTRLRVGVGGGWVLERSRFHLPVSGLATVEPWWVREGSRSVRLRDATGERLPSGPALGIATRVEPGVRWELDPMVVSLGLMVEAAVSAGFAGGVHVPQIRREAGVLFQIGGVELGFGLNLSLRWRVRTGSR